MTFFLHVPILRKAETEAAAKISARPFLPRSTSNASKSSTETANSPPQHVTLFRLVKNQDQLIDAIYFVLDTLDERSERVGDVVDKSVRDPVGRHRDVVLELLDSTTDVLRMGSSSEVELGRAKGEREQRQDASKSELSEERMRDQAVNEPKVYPP